MAIGISMLTGTKGGPKWTCTKGRPWRNKAERPGPLSD